MPKPTAQQDETVNCDVTVTVTRSVAEAILARTFSLSRSGDEWIYGRRRTTDAAQALTWALVDIAENGTCLGSTALRP